MESCLECHDENWHNISLAVYFFRPQPLVAHMEPSRWNSLWFGHFVSCRSVLFYSRTGGFFVCRAAHTTCPLMNRVSDDPVDSVRGGGRCPKVMRHFYSLSAKYGRFHECQQLSSFWFSHVSLWKWEQDPRLGPNLCSNPSLIPCPLLLTRNRH